MRLIRYAAAVCALLATAASNASALQLARPLGYDLAAPSHPNARALVQSPQAAGSRLGPAALSLVAPGLGQHELGQGRKWVYAALELVGWAIFLERRSSGGEYRDRYRDFAWEQGRLQQGPRIDGDFDYYETLTQWTASGAYDADPALAGVQPETDPTTYNGSIWQRATQIFIAGGGSALPSDPAYQSALAYYDERAYGSAFLWDWAGTPGGQEELGDLIRASDDRFRHSTTALGFLIANHLVSAADAYLSARRSPVRVSAAQRAAGGRWAWAAALTVRLGP